MILEKATAKVLPFDDDGNIGYVAVYRTLFSKGWYNKSEYVHLWLHLLMKATHKGMETWFDSKSLKLKPGQFVTGRKKLARETGINESKVERILKCFEIEQQIEQVSCSTSRLISINNWGKYQSGEQVSKQRVNSGRTASEQRANTKQECNNDNKEKKVDSAALPLPPSEEEKEFLEVQEWIKATAPRVNQLAEPLNIKQYYNLKNQFGVEAVPRILLAMHNWKDLTKKRVSAYLTFLSFAKREKND